MDKLLHFIVIGVEHIAIATVLLILGLLFAPEAFSLAILRRIKPDLVSRRQIMEKARNVFEVFLGKKAIVPSPLLPRASWSVILMVRPTIPNSRVFNEPPVRCSSMLKTTVPSRPDAQQAG
jgi:hypothetical protein